MPYNRVQLEEAVHKLAKDQSGRIYFGYVDLQLNLGHKAPKLGTYAQILTPTEETCTPTKDKYMTIH